MSDTLIYRLPGSSVIQQTGSFLLSEEQEPTGFIISDFLHHRVYVFQENPHSEAGSLHVPDHEPVVISPRDYQIEAQAMLHAFPVMEVQKAVYSRVKKVGFPIEKAKELFHELEASYPNAFVYLVSSSLFGTWIGATPETLIETKGQDLYTMALAGTHAADDYSDWTKKEYEEHQYVVEAIEAALKRNNCSDIQFSGPKETLAGPVKHLQTPFKATLSDYSAWRIAMDLHPTPAVCGTPRMAALDLLLSREMHERFLYAGIIGLSSPESTRLYVNLRCAQIQQEKMFLYLGGGYTKDSIPDLEWEETEKKARTLLGCVEKILR